MKNTLRFTLGDDSGDGHSQTKDFVILSNKTAREFELISKSQKEKTGFDLTEYCEEYEDNTINNEAIDRWKELGVQFDWKDAEDIYVDSYFELWMAICKFVDPSFEWEYLDMQDVNIQPGYGLFYS